MDMTALFLRLGGIEPVATAEFNPVSEAELIAIEAGVGVRLPESYRKFLKTFGASKFTGASPDNPFIVFRPLKPLPPHFKSGTGPFDLFYGAARDEHDGHSLRVRIRYFSGRIPESVIPIGDDGIAGQICLGIKAAEVGKVYYWDQQNEPQDEEDYLEDYGVPRPREAIFKNVHLIAESFEDFLQRLDVMLI